MNVIQECDWVDTEDMPNKRIDLQLEKADALIDEYRAMYTPDTPHDELYNDVAKLYFMKETTSIVEAYGSYADRRLRIQEGMLGFLGGKSCKPEALY